MIRSVCVFCGASAGVLPAYLEAARAMGKAIARRSLRLVYGGGDSGLMGELSRAAFSAGAEVIGVIPCRLNELVAPADLTELVVVEDMRERKSRMHELADAFLALPGGIGTLEEFFEAWTWRALGFHGKPVGILEVEGFWAPLRGFLEGVVESGFLGREHLADLIVSSDPEGLLDALERLPELKAHKKPERSRRE